MVFELTSISFLDNKSLTSSIYPFSTVIYNAVLFKKNNYLNFIKKKISF